MLNCAAIEGRNRFSPTKFEGRKVINKDILPVDIIDGAISMKV